MEWPTLRECEEVVGALLQLAEDYDKEELLTPSDTQRVKDTLQKPVQHNDEEGPGQNEPESEEQPARLTVHEYCCFMVAKFVNNLDAFARAKAAPKTKTYALDTDACEDPTVHRMLATDGMDISFEDVPEDADIDGYVRRRSTGRSAAATIDRTKRKGNRLLPRADVQVRARYDRRRLVADHVPMKQSQKKLLC